MRTIPRPLVRFQQTVFVTVLLLAFLLQQPWLVAGLFTVALVALVGGAKANLLFAVGRCVLRSRLPGALPEDAGAQRFNLTIATVLMGAGALSLLVLKNPVLGWAFAGMVVFAAGLALTGFCIGCVLYLRLRFVRQRLFGTKAA